MQTKELKTKGYVIKRTNYGESDRILSLITPQGKINVMAKGIRKPRSKLAGAVELFSYSHYDIHFGKGDLGILTGAKMISYHSKILKNFDRLKLAGFILKKINQVAEDTNSDIYFNLTHQSLDGLNSDLNPTLIEAWFLLRFTKATGEEINLYRDTNDTKLSENNKYDYDIFNTAFVENQTGEYSSNDIKALRLFSTADLNLVQRIKLDDKTLQKIQNFARMVAHI